MCTFPLHPTLLSARLRREMKQRMAITINITVNTSNAPISTSPRTSSIGNCGTSAVLIVSLPERVELDSDKSGIKIGPVILLCRHTTC